MIKYFAKYIIFKIYMLLTARLSFLHYYILSRRVRVPQFSEKGGIQGNYCYGNRQAVVNATGKDYRPKCMIEHGLYFGRNVLEDECVYPEIDTIYTYSPYRKEVLYEYFGKNFTKRIEPIGPYLIHAKHHMSESARKRLKKKWGRTLLIFPSHSSPEGDTSFDYNAWLSEIELRAKDYNTVVVCLYWLDIYNGNYLHYKEKGYKLACCGGRFDQQFLSRQKDLISLADMTISNDLGTHVGYCIAMGKPHYVYLQKVLFKEYEAFKGTDKSTDEAKYYFEQEKKHICGLFSKFEEVITEEQKKAIRYYWGKF